MVNLFNTILKMSTNASVVILAVIILRFLMKNAPKRYSYLLWIAVGFRLCSPVSFRSFFSIFSIGKPKAPSLPDSGGDIVLEGPYNGIINDGIVDTFGGSSVAERAVSSAEIFNTAVMIVWFAGMTLMLVYSFYSYFRLKNLMSNAVLYTDNIYMSEKVQTPFTLGFFKPKIYIPFGLSQDTQAQILTHEYAHIRRFDHIVKPMAFLILTVHWFNPMCWIAFGMMSLDMEMCCDERVLRIKGDEDMKKNYTKALVSFATNRHISAPSPIAFSESYINVKRRINNALNWKKSNLWVNILCITLCFAALVSCAADAENSNWNEVETESFDEVPYNIVYTSHGDGTCTVSEIRVDFNHGEDIHLIIPENAPNGDKVIAIDASFDNRTTLNLPRYMTVDGYKETIKSIKDAKEVTTSIAVNSERDADIFESFYALKHTEDGNEYYFFEPSASYEERLRVARVLADYGFGEEDCFRALNEFVESMEKDSKKDEFTRDAFKTVYSIGENISEITIPKSVKLLGFGAFNGCDNLERVNGLHDDLSITVCYTEKAENGIEAEKYDSIGIFDERLKSFSKQEVNEENLDFLKAVIK